MSIDRSKGNDEKLQLLTIILSGISLVISISMLIYMRFYHHNSLILRCIKLSVGHDFVMTYNISNLGNRDVLIREVELRIQWVSDNDYEPCGDPVIECSKIPFVIKPNEIHILEIPLGRDIYEIALEAKPILNVVLFADTVKEKQFFLISKIDFSKEGFPSFDGKLSKLTKQYLY
ncbi:hypothetical protein SFA71_01680 [Legionella pneumophila subsp. fraseri]|nr:hypothetical protein [Legionella pneumophila subsp. fraseri]MDW9062352.1 hypothetical protein [Legionella pneumophila subsp. fraseri]HAU1193894.1 hypothetical protein [Legionella pneumophila]